VLKSAQVNTQTKQTQCAMPKVLKLVLEEPQVPRVAVCPTEVDYGGRGKKLPGATAVSLKTGRVTLAALPGTMALRAVAPEAVGPVVETCAPRGRTTASTSVVDVLLVWTTASASVVDVPLVQPGTAVEKVETCASGEASVSASVVDVPLVKPSIVVETREASDVQTMSPTSRGQVHVASAKAQRLNNNALVEWSRRAED